METILSREEILDTLGIGKDKFAELVRSDPDFVTFKTGHRGRRMRASALKRWIEIQEQKSR